MESKVDTLYELAPEQIEALCNYYKSRQEDAAHVYSFLKTVLVWHKKQSSAEQKYITVLAPNGDWEPEGTFISIHNFQRKFIFLYTMDPGCKRLVDALEKTNRVELRNTIFYAVHERHEPFITKLLIEKGLKKKFHDDTHVWRLDQEAAILRKAELLSDEFTMVTLKPEDAEIVNDHWPHKEVDSILYVRALIEMNGGYGIFKKDEQKLVAWVLKSQIGQLALLQVIEGYQRKGLAGIVTNKMAQEIASDGCSVIGTVITTNIPSQRLFKKLGFEQRNICSFFSYA